MASRPVFVVYTDGVREEGVEFNWFPGFSVSQKQKSIESLHQNYLAENPESKILEVSSKSIDTLGIQLSAFNLKIQHNQKKIPVENIFQSSKVFEKGGPYQDLLLASPREAKTDARLKGSGELTKFEFLGDWPLKPKTLFYDWIYLKALSENQHLSTELINFDAFSDIEYNPSKSFNCQARSAALFVYLHNQNLLHKVLEDPNYLKKKLDGIYAKSKVIETQQQSLFWEEI